MRRLFDILAGPPARPTTRGVRFGPFRTVSFDGRSSIKVPESDRNVDRFWPQSRGGYPTVELMTLVETGTRALIGAVFGPTGVGANRRTPVLARLPAPEPDLPVASQDHPHTPPDDRRRQRVLDLLDTEPDRHRHPRELARRLGDVTLGTMRRQLDRWAGQGLIHKAGPATYASQYNPLPPARMRQLPGLGPSPVKCPIRVCCLPHDSTRATGGFRSGRL